MPHGPCSLVGNPISFTIGNKYQREVDYPGEGTFSLGLVRSYNSQAIIAGTLGVNWSWTYSRSIQTLTANSVNVTRPDGKIYNFSGVNGVYASDADVNGRLTGQTDASGNPIGWQYTNSEGQVEAYDNVGKLLSITDRSGLVQTLSYSDGMVGGVNNDYTLDASGNPTTSVLPAGLPIRVKDSYGKVIGFGYDGASRLVKLTDPAGGVITYGYDSQSNLAAVTYPNGTQRLYWYNEQANTNNINLPNALTGITDENGDRYATYQYSADGKAISTGHAGGADLYSLSYSTTSTTVTDPLGTQRTYDFTTILGVVKSTGVSQPGGSGCGAASSAITYDANGNVASRADFNDHKTCYAYDLTRNLETARVEGLASGASCPTSLATYTPAANSAERKILTDWDSRFRLPVSIVEAGRETDYVYDSHGNVTSRSIKDLASGQTRTWTTSYTYHASVPGVLVQKIDNGPRIDVADLTTTDYYAPDENCTGDPLGCRGQVKQVTNALGHITHVDQYDANGRVLQTTDPNGLVTTLSYSPRGWLLSRSVGTETTSFDYDGVGQLTKLTRPDASYVSFEYDPAHRLVAIVDQNGNRLTYTLDAAGNRIHEAITGPGGSTVYYAHSRTFDALGRLWQDIGAYNQTITYQYDAQGNLKQIDGARTDVADETTHVYDTLDRLTRTLNADGGVVQVKPNALDQTTQVVDPVNQATTQTVDAFGDVTRTVSADTGTTSRTFDEAGNEKTETDARGVTVSYTYDALNRLTQKQSSDAATPVYTYGYDQCGLGRLCWIQRNGTFHLYFNYDSYGRLNYQLGAIPGVTWLYGQYFYDSYGRLSKLVYPTGRSVSYSYDPEGRNSQVTTQPSSGTPVTVLASNFVYSYPFAGPQSFQYGNGKGYYQSRDQDYRPTYSFDGPRYKLYGYDMAGSVASITDISNTALTYAYDATGRLVSAVDSATNSFGSLAWTYDKNGNRQSETRNAGTIPYAYSPPNWLYQKGSDTRYRTPSGNTASSAVGSFAYDGYNRLASSQTAAETTTYTYNALGQRIKKINQNGLATSFHYGPDGELLYEQDQAGNTRAYVWLDGRPLARIDNNAQIYYYHVDHLGTPQVMSDATGSLVWKAAYEPFGKATVSTASNVENNLRLPGQYYDRETGLHYNYARDYDPGTGRYIESDPIGLRGGINIYTYVSGNPISKVDPLGLANGPAVKWMNIKGSWTKNFPMPAYQSLGDMLSDPNGNMYPGFDAQDNKCSLGPIFGPLTDACVVDRCRRHDNCYADNRCNWSSWAPSLIGGTKSCNQCNSGFFKDHGASGNW
ncbi:RHS repeat-associated core domain-containing protein [Thiobacillus sp.]